MARVLVVDDEPGVRTALARGLSAEGMDIVAVGDGPSALRAALTGSFDAVVLDIILPGLSGYRVLERMRQGVGTPCPVLRCAIENQVEYCLGCDKFPCDVHYEHQTPYSKKALDLFKRFKAKG